MSLMCIDLYETGGLLLFSSKSIIFQTADLERVIEKAENIINFYLDFNWELRFILTNIRITQHNSKSRWYAFRSSIRPYETEKGKETQEDMAAMAGLGLAGIHSV